MILFVLPKGGDTDGEVHIGRCYGGDKHGTESAMDSFSELIKELK